MQRQLDEMPQQQKWVDMYITKILISLSQHFLEDKILKLLVKGCAQKCFTINISHAIK